MLVNQTRCLRCNTVSKREEKFYDLNLQIMDCNNLIKSLRQYCSAEILDGDSSYDCEVCKTKQTAHRSTVLTKLPIILTFSCNRFKIDRTTNWERQKIIDICTFPIILDMNMFIDGAEGVGEILHADKDIEDEFITNLQNSMVWIDDICNNAYKYAENFIDKDINTANNIIDENENKADISKMLNNLTNIELNEIESILTSPVNKSRSADMNIGENINCLDRDNKYQLVSVIMHKGSAHSGFLIICFIYLIINQIF